MNDRIQAVEPESQTLLDLYNPLLEHIEYVRLTDWPEVLEFDPLKGINFGALSEEKRDVYIALIHQRFAPTAIAIEVAAALQTMMRTSYVLRNPTLAEQKVRMVEIAKTRGKPASAVPIGPPLVFAKMITSITGLGKTAILWRALDHVPQVIVHGKNEAAGWSRRVQITYLIVSMSANRGGLLYAILEAIDAQAKTTYREQYAKQRQWTVEKLFVEVAAILAFHFVGLLIIEEVQARNFAMSPFREEMLLFFLRLLNYAIPVVMVGNPLGFVQVEDFSQDMRRLTRSDPVELMPAASMDEVDWNDGIAPAIWSYGEQPGDAPYGFVRSVLWANSGGFPGYEATIGEGTLRQVLSGGVRDVSMLERFCKESRQLKKNRDLIEGFAQRDPRKLSRYLDVPWEDYAIGWGYKPEDVLDLATTGDLATLPRLEADEADALLKVHAMLRASYARQLGRRLKKSASGKTGAARIKTDGCREGTVTSRNLAAGLAALKGNLTSARRTAT